MPLLRSRGVKGLIPLGLKVERDAPSTLVILEPHAHKMTAFRGLFAVDEALASVEDGQVIDEVDIACLGADLKLDSLRNFLDLIQSLNLAGTEGG
jgi:hypothetical protein